MSDDVAITERIIQAVIRVHQALGPGFLERIYHNALILELVDSGLTIESEKEIVIFYGERPVGKHQLGLVVASRVIVEIKTVEALSQAHYAQVRSYLRASNLTVGLLINFAKERADFRRVELKP